MTDTTVYLVMVAGFAPLICTLAYGLHRPTARHFIGAYAVAGAWFGLCLWRLAA